MPNNTHIPYAWALLYHHQPPSPRRAAGFSGALLTSPSPDQTSEASLVPCAWLSCGVGILRAPLRESARLGFVRGFPLNSSTSGWAPPPPTSTAVRPRCARFPGYPDILLKARPRAGCLRRCSRVQSSRELSLLYLQGIPTPHWQLTSGARWFSYHPPPASAPCRRCACRGVAAATGAVAHDTPTLRPAHQRQCLRPVTQRLLSSHHLGRPSPLRPNGASL